MTPDERNEQEDEVRRIVAQFAWQYFHDRILWQAGQLVPGLDMAILDQTGQPMLAPDNILSRTMQPREWLDLARYGAGLGDGDAGEMYEICQSLAEWLFAIPGSAAYGIPSEWYETPLGALWARAFARTQGDELITVAEAARLAGVTPQAISARISRGTLRSIIDPLAKERQGRRLVYRSAVTKAG